MSFLIFHISFPSLTNTWTLKLAGLVSPLLRAQATAFTFTLFILT